MINRWGTLVGMAKFSLSAEARRIAAEKGEALPDGSFPIRNRRELLAAVQRRKAGNISEKRVIEHIRKRAEALGVEVDLPPVGSEEPAQVMMSSNEDSVIVISFDPAALVAAGGKYGRSPSLKWPWLFDTLKAKGYDASKAAAISNSRLKFRKKGRLNVLTRQQAHNPAVMARVRKAQEAGKMFRMKRA